jgi:hypothetical protein
MGNGWRVRSRGRQAGSWGPPTNCTVLATRVLHRSDDRQTQTQSKSQVANNIKQIKKSQGHEKDQGYENSDPESTAVQKTISVMAPRTTLAGVGCVAGVGDVPRCVAPSPPVSIGFQPAMQQNQDFVPVQWEFVCNEAHPTFRRDVVVRRSGTRSPDGSLHVLDDNRCPEPTPSCDLHPNGRR